MQCNSSVIHYVAMKKILSIALIFTAFVLSGIPANAARAEKVTVRGNVIDSNGEAVSYATIIVNDSNSNLAAGIASDEHGSFQFEVAPGDYSICVSLIGYTDTTIDFTASGVQMTLSPIVMNDDTEMLNAATVQAVIPKTKLTGEGLQTSVRGTVLENAGTAVDVLSKTPGMMQGQDGLEVIGKGSPVIYINGHKVSDSSELKRLMSNEIQSIEVINNPGAQYDAQVRSVVRIKTIKKQGEGFGFNLDLTDEQSLRKADFNDPNGNFNFNYRINGVDLFAGVNAFRFSSRQVSDLTSENLLAPRFTQESDLVSDYVQKSAYWNGGANWQISDNHSVGFKVTYGGEFNVNSYQTMNDKAWKEGVLYDDLQTESSAHSGDIKPHNTTANIYYNGNVKKLGIDLNFDYYGAGSSSISATGEKSTIEDRDIKYSTINDSRMYAGKLVFSYPIWQGQLQAGTEDVFSNLSEEYSITGAPIPSSNSEVSEKNYAAFANYAFYLPKVGQFSAGLRYEYVDYSYHALGGTDKENIDRQYSNLFPSASYAGAIGKVQAMLSYSIKTARPSFSYLSDAVRYNNKYTLQSGNASIQPTYIHSLSATAVWKYFAFQTNYEKYRDNMATWSERYVNPDGSVSDGVILVSPKNLDEPTHVLLALVNATPTIGIWSLNCTAAVQQQWLTIHYKDKLDPSLNRDLSFSNKPIVILQMFNTFSLKKGWQLEFGGEFHSKGYTANMMITNNYLDLSAAIQKSLLKDGSLVLRLSGSDLAGLADNNVHADFGGHLMTQTNTMDTRRVKLALRYNFNTASNKYKGSGAGSDVKDRMKN